MQDQERYVCMVTNGLYNGTEQQSLKEVQVLRDHRDHGYVSALHEVLQGQFQVVARQKMIVKIGV